MIWHQSDARQTYRTARWILTTVGNTMVVGKSGEGAETDDEFFQGSMLDENGNCASLSEGPIGSYLEKWAWLFQRAEELDADTLRFLLPETPFQKMIGILEMGFNDK